MFIILSDTFNVDIYLLVKYMKRIPENQKVKQFSAQIAMSQEANMKAHELNILTRDGRRGGRVFWQSIMTFW